MLTPENVTAFGGKVEMWYNAWTEVRKERLRRAVE